MKYYSTYFNNYSIYSKETIFNELDYILSGAKEGTSKLRSYRIKNTIITNSSKPISNISLHNFLERAKIVIGDKVIEDNYDKFFIPKRSGGKREILAPKQWLLDLQTSLVNILKTDYKVLEHNAAHAYTENRSIVTNAETHKNNYNFVNMDLSNFFPSITREVIVYSLLRISNLKRVFLSLRTDLVETFFKIILYNGALPQGSAASPFISNIVLIPFDYHLTEILKENRRNITYTRYADDLTFSSKPKIYINEIRQFIEQAKQNAYGNIKDFININEKKTRLTTYRGKNRITGVKVNAENKLSIGYKEKQRLKMDMVSLIINKKNGYKNDTEQVEQTLGMFSYLNSVEPNYANYLLRKWSTKFSINNIYKYLTSN